MYVLEWRIVSALTRGLLWCLFPDLRSNEGNEYQNKTWVSAETVRHEGTYIISFLHEITNSKMTMETTIFPKPHSLGFRSADDVTMTRQLWRDRMNNGI